jgi:uncharacterized protein (TIGR02001 family)
MSFCSKAGLVAEETPFVNSTFDKDSQEKNKHGQVNQDAAANPAKLIQPEENQAKKKESNAPTPKEKKEDVSTHTLTGSVAFLSDYRSRGISQTFRRPAVQGEFKYTHISGFYFKNWASSVDGTGNLLNNTSMEWDLYIGIKHSLFDSKAEYDIGFLYYYYSRGRAPVRANTSYGTLEYYVSVTYKDFQIKLSETLTDYFGVNSSNPPLNWDIVRPIKPNGNSYGSLYLEANYEFSVNAKTKLDFHIGYQTITHYSQLNYLDWLVMLTREFEWFNFTLTYVSTNANKTFYNVRDHSFHPKRKDLGGPTIVLGVYRTY